MGDQYNTNHVVEREEEEDGEKNKKEEEGEEKTNKEEEKKKKKKMMMMMMMMMMKKKKKNNNNNNQFLILCSNALMHPICVSFFFNCRAKNCNNKTVLIRSCEDLFLLPVFRIASRHNTCTCSGSYYI